MPQYTGHALIWSSLGVGLISIVVACNSDGPNDMPGAGVDPDTTGPGAPSPTSSDAGVHAPGSGPSASPGDAGTAPKPADPPCTDKMPLKGDQILQLSGGRTARVHAPDSYDPKKRTMLVFNYHGLGSNGIQQVLLTGMSGTSDKKGFIVVYPNGTDASWNAGDCCDPARANKVDELAFTKEVLEAVKKDYCIDSTRTYATGFSNGGFMTHDLACNMSDTFAAVAPVSGVLGVAPESCKPKRPMPILHIHGDADAIVPYDGGKPLGLELGYNFRSVADSTAFWRKQDMCPASPTISFQKGDSTCQKWGPCAGGSEVVLCTVSGGGHAWPSGLPLLTGKTTFDLDATEMITSFFEAHPMPR